MTTLSFDDMLDLVADRSAAFRAAAAAAPAGAQVPGCPDWQVSDLVAHLGEVHRWWAAAIAAGPAPGPPDPSTIEGRTPLGDLLTWSADCTADLISALRAAGPDRDCWTWWPESSTPSNSGAVARHQVQESAIHARDAQETAGHAEPLSAAIATDGVDEFLATCLGACGPWKLPPAQVALQISGGPGWLLDLSEKGAVVVPSGLAGAAQPTAAITGSASDLVLALYGRVDLDTMQLAGDRAVLRQLLDWAPVD
ncbi:MAG: maleylpyruvate isomerase family mycothiol-dependent enzyme [Actinomycetota bacterium]